MINRARELWEGLGRTNQIILVVSTLGVMVALIGFIAWATTPEYVPLFSNLSAQDANAISDKLREANIPFRLTQSGTALEVPAGARDETRMKMISQGLPAQTASVPGYELLDKTNSMTETQQQQDTMLMRAREGEISKSIMSLQQVANASVHLAAADNSPFVSDKHPASASVLVGLKSGLSLSDENVRAIVRLTQMSVTGLSEKDISVVDQQGNLLFDGSRGSAGTASDEHIKAQRNIAQAKRMELQSALDQAIGPRKAIVLVNVELNADQRQIKKNIIETGAVTSAQNATEELNGGGTVKGGGAPGAGANLPNSNQPLVGGATPGAPTYASASTNDANSHYKNTTTNKTMEPSHTEELITYGDDRIEKMTVSALVDTKVPPEQVASIEQTLKTAIGATPGDNTRLVSVSQIAFDRSGEEQEAKAEATEKAAENTAHLLATAVPLAIMVLAFLLLARALRKPRMGTSGQMMLAGAGGMGMLPGGGLGIEGMNLALGPDGMPLPGQTIAGNRDTEPLGLMVGSQEPKVYDVIEEAFDAHLESILHLARSKPEMVAMLVRSWTAKED